MTPGIRGGWIRGAGHRGGWDQRRWPDLAREAREALARNALGAREMLAREAVDLKRGAGF
jgi:hypothetical protein